MLNKINWHLSFFILCVSMIMGGFISIHFGKDLSWDLANYHYYAPYAFFHHRWQIDFWPTSYVNLFFPPTIDFLTYFLIHQFSPKEATYLIGALQGINFWLIYLISYFFLAKETQITRPIFLSLILAFVGIYAPSTFTSMGSFQHDLTVSIFVLGFIYLQLQSLQHFSFSMRSIFLSSFILGCGAGLKLTVAMYVAGAFGAFLLLPLSFAARIRWCVYASIGIGTGVLVTTGYWMWFLWQHYHNPFLGYVNLQAAIFFPKTWLQKLFFPFYFSWNPSLINGGFARDFRYPILYVLCVVYSIYRLGYARLSAPIFLTWLILFFIFSYIFWQIIFCVPRYDNVLTMLAPLLIFLIVFQIFHNHYLKMMVASILLLIMMVTMRPMLPFKEPLYEGDYFNIQLPSLVQQLPTAMVLMAYPAYTQFNDPVPQAYLIPSFPEKWQFIGIPIFLDTFITSPDLLSRIKRYQGGSVFILANERSIIKLYDVAIYLGFYPAGDCEVITSEAYLLTGSDQGLTLLCPIRKTPRPLFTLYSTKFQDLLGFMS